MKAMGCDPGLDPRVARLIDANLDRAREGLRVVEDWCRFGLDREDLVVTLKDWRQRLGRLHQDRYKKARSTSTDTGAGLGHPAQLDRHSPRQVVAANCGRVQEALRVLEEYGRSIDAPLAKEAAAVRYGLYDLEVTCLEATAGNNRRSRLEDCRLCLVTSPSDHLIATVSAALRSGVGMVQYRAKNGSDLERFEEARSLAEICHQHGALFIVNDRIDLALAVDADGVHLGQDDLPTAVARRLIGTDRLLGRSTHNLDQVRQANAEACDYLGLGPINNTAVKPDRNAIGSELVAHAMPLGERPIFAIGGISSANLDQLIEVGCRRVAVIGAIMGADDPGAACAELLRLLMASS